MPSRIELPSGLSAQVVTGVSGDNLVYRTIADGATSGVIPQGVAVVLVNESKSHDTFTLVPSSATASYSGKNYLYGSDEATTTTASGSNYYYKLTYGDSGKYNGVFGWYWGATNGAAFRIDGHKAWLALPKSMSTRSSFNMDDVTGVESISSDECKDVYYDLQGRRVNRPTTTGIYILNGKKVVIK